ncbi:unnamed protein product [Lactuca saligna]|uniref:ABC transporter domain-containing protein n=1 Tax=Lactuca saligna TaxID=75948 RepID=A0AA35UNI4_LACSI|nr:unnamed protein product [Lactuca saligna]
MMKMIIMLTLAMKKIIRTRMWLSQLSNQVGLIKISKTSGTVGVFGSTAYVIQTSWIQSGTIYNDADIYLLDDPFSGLEAHTKATLFNVMKDGQVTQSEKYEKLLMAGTAFEELVNAHKDVITGNNKLLASWSAGQRQLFCLGGVLLRRNKILVLDEATIREADISRLSFAVELAEEFYGRVKNHNVEFATYFKYCRSLTFDQKPNYGFLKRLFRDLLTREGFDFYYVFDWVIIKHHQSEKNKPHMVNRS